MSSSLPTDEALEKEDRLEKMKSNKNKTKQKKNSPPIPHQTLALPYANLVGRPGTGSYPAPSPDPTIQRCYCVNGPFKDLFFNRNARIIQVHGHQSISFIAYTNGTKLSVSYFWEQNLETWQTLTERLNIAIRFNE